MMDKLIREVSQCTLCRDFLPNAPRPVFSVHPKARVLIIGQAPGKKAHECATPWNDPSGDELRRWLGVDRETFYDPEIFALMPMGFCFPGKKGRGDAPPRPECAPQWHTRIREGMNHIRITLLIGQYAQKYYLGKHAKNTLTDTVKAYREYLPEYLPLVHPSPRNIFWRQSNPWFEREIVPFLQNYINNV